MKSYLDQLRFDERLRNTFLAGYLTNIRLVALLILSILVIGAASFATLPRRLNPEINIPIVIVSTVLPGASPTDVESLITIPLENEINNANGIDILASSSQENVSSISIQFQSSVEVNEARDEVQRLVDSVNNLPADASTPRVQSLDFEDVPIWEFALTTSADQASLETLSERLRHLIEEVPHVDRVVVSGAEQKEIQVTADPTRLLELQISPQQLSQAVKAATQALPAGTVTTQNTDFAVSINSSVTTLDQLRLLPLQVGEQTILLQDVATVQYRSAPYQKRSYISKAGGEVETAIRFSIYKTSGSDIEGTQRAVQNQVEEYLQPYGETVHLVTLENVAADITKQFSELGSNFLSTIALVFLTLLIFLGVRQATIASLSIPLTILVSFAVMQVTGQTLNFLSLFSLLLALGLLVDDAIVVVQSMTAYFKTGRFSAEEVGLLVWRDFIVPIWTTTITTVWAFVPLLLASGIIGEFIKSIPIVVSSTLLTSTFVAVFITLPMMIALLKLEIPHRVRVLGAGLLAAVFFILIIALTQSVAAPALPVVLVLLGIFFLLTYRWRTELLHLTRDRSQQILKHPWAQRVGRTLDSGLIDLNPAVRRYHDIIDRILAKKGNKRRVIIGVVAFSLFSYLLVPLGFVKNEFFPEDDYGIMYVGVELPSGTNQVHTEKLALEVLETLRQVPEAEVVQSDVGQSPMASDGSSGGGGTNTARFTIRLKPEGERDRTAQEISSELRQIFDTETRAKITVSIPSGGPPAGGDVALKIIGPDLSQLQLIANEVEDYLRQQPGVINIDRSIKGGPSKLVFVPNQAELARYNLSPQQLGFELRTALSGFELDELTLPGDIDPVSIQFRLYDRIVEPEELSQITVMTSQGPLPLSQLGSFALESNPTAISREDRQRTLTVMADVTADHSVSEVNAALLKHTETMELPTGYSFATGGVNEENEKSVQSILRAMIVAVLLILVTMVVQLGSFRKALLVVLVIPLAVSGVFVLFALSGTPLSFPALIGVLALFGIVVNNSIMLVEKINQNLAIGMKQKPAISDAAASRLEPILFSSLTTITGLIPITVTDPLWRGLGGGIIAGLFLSGAIMLFFIPVVYDMWYPEENITAHR